MSALRLSNLLLYMILYFFLLYVNTLLKILIYFRIIEYYNVNNNLPKQYFVQFLLCKKVPVICFIKQFKFRLFCYLDYQLIDLIY